MAQRVAVFIDYQNVYRRAREAFGFDRLGRHMDGQIRPNAVGLTLRGPRESGRQLVSVHVYRGLPSSRFDPKGYEAAQRQIAAWNKAGGDIFQCHARPLNYRDPAHPREKGVDVQLAVDFVLGAVRREI